MGTLTDGALNPQGSRTVQQIVEQLKNFYQGLGARERGIFTAAILASLITLGGVFYWASQDTWKPVFTSSDPGEVQSAAAILEEKGVPYRISPDGMRAERVLRLLVPVRTLDLKRLKTLSWAHRHSGNAGPINGRFKVSS